MNVIIVLEFDLESYELGLIMMKTEVSFRITGPCLSMLLGDGECCKSDQVRY